MKLQIYLTNGGIIFGDEYTEEKKNLFMHSLTTSNSQKSVVELDDKEGNKYYIPWENILYLKWAK